MLIYIFKNRIYPLSAVQNRKKTDTYRCENFHGGIFNIPSPRKPFEILNLLQYTQIKCTHLITKFINLQETLYVKH